MLKVNNIHRGQGEIGMVTWQDVKQAVERLGVAEGDSLLVHSSFKSLGEVENGADSVIRGLQSALGETGTLIFPTLCSRDWEHVYDNWHMDAPSDIGYLTNYFRKLPGAKRSNQATHSVAAIGPKAEYLTATHGQSGLRHGIYGSTCFSVDSPWEKMCEENAKMLFLGCTMHSCTMRHLVEYRYMDAYLQKAKCSPRYQELFDRVWCYDKWDDRGVWWHIKNLYIQELLEREGKVHTTQCGNATLTLVNARDFAECATEQMERRNLEAFFVDNGNWDPQDTLDWLAEVDAL